ncbi:MAG: LapA family protein [Neomegalonema sp.]|nr:LapA family protein [Neomegalonema sp.]
MRWISRLFWLPVLIVLAAVMVTNSQPVEINLDPFGLGFAALQPRQVPLFYIILAALALGLIVGIVMLYDKYRPVRRSLRDSNREVVVLRRQNEQFRQSMKAMDNPDSVAPPALPRR